MSTLRNNNDLPKLTISETIKLLKIAATKINSPGKQGIFIWGSPGIGKSDLVRRFASETGRTFIDIRLTTIDPVDLRGLPVINHEKEITKWLPPDFLPQKNSPAGILFLDEINAAPPSIQAAAYQLILDRRIGSYQVPDNWLIIAAGNRLGDKSITFKLPSALANRFSHFEIKISPEEWYQWAREVSIDPYIISFLRFQPEMLNQFAPEKNETVFPTPRSWAFVSTFSEIREKDLQLYYQSIVGTVGKSAAQQFFSFIRYSDKIPDPEDILEGNKYKIPETIDMQYLLMDVLIQHLVNNWSEKRIANFFLYAMKFVDTAFVDYSIILVKELINVIKHDKSINKMQELSSHPSFKSWSKKNKDILTT